MIKKIWCWLTGHRLYLYAFCKDGMITIHRKDTSTICTELYRCSTCGYTDGDGAEGLSWTGQLHYVDFRETQEK